MPNNITFARSEGKSKDNYPKIEDEKVQRLHDATIAWLKFLSWKLTGLCGTEQDMEQFRFAYDEAMGIAEKRSNRTAFYKGESLCSIDYSTHKSDAYKKGRAGDIGTTRLSPSKYVTRDLTGGFLPEIVLNTTQKYKVHFVIKTP